MNKNKIKAIFIFLLIVPFVVSLILSCTNVKDLGDNIEKDSYVDTLYIPDTINNRNNYIIKNTNYFVYICIFGFVSFAGLTYLVVRYKIDNK